MVAVVQVGEMTITSRAEPDVEPNGATAGEDDDNGNDDCNNKPLFILIIIMI